MQSINKIILIFTITIFAMLAGCTSDSDIDNYSSENIRYSPESGDDQQQTDSVDAIAGRDIDAFILKEDIGKYSYLSSDDFRDAEMYRISVSGFSATYRLRNTEAKVNIIFSEDYQALVKEMTDNRNLELLGSEDYGFEGKKVYYDPYDNFYIWPSDGYIVKVDNSIGFDLLNSYIKKHPYGNK